MSIKKTFLISSFLYIALVFPCYVFATDCSDDNSCRISGNQSTWGLYCKFGSGPTPNTCSQCNLPPDSSEYYMSCEFTQNYTGTGIDSCEWSCTCLQQKVFCNNDHTECGKHDADQQQPVTGHGQTNSVCSYGNESGLNCYANFYRDGNECKSCATETNGNYTESAANSVGKSSCYKTCATVNIKDGNITIGRKVPNPAQQTAYFGNECTYDIQCNTNGGTCNAGYHSNGTTCVANAIQDNCGNNSYKFYDTNSSEYTQCLVSQQSCRNSFGDSGFRCNSTRYGTCNETTKPCNEISVLVTTCGNGNDVSGNAGIANNYSYLSPQYTDYSNCLCNKQDQSLYSDGVQVGIADMSYKFNSSGNQLESNPTSISVKKCIAGYYSDNNQRCIKTQQNHYSKADDKEQHNCPYGSKTSGTGSTSINDCGYPAGTQFYDGNGSRSFTIPVSAQLSQTVINSQQN